MSHCLAAKGHRYNYWKNSTLLILLRTAYNNTYEYANQIVSQWLPLCTVYRMGGGGVSAHALCSGTFRDCPITMRSTQSWGEVSLTS